MTPTEAEHVQQALDPRRRARRLGDVTSNRQNNFDVLRLFAAWIVLVSHSFALTGRDEPLHQFESSLGNVGVLVFFAISGLLIHRSWDYDPSFRDFWAKRALRLFPGLAVVSVLTAFVLGPVVTRLPLTVYLTSAETLVYPFRITLLAPFGAELPGVFEGNPVGGAVNGSLWSLPVEVLAYGALAVLGLVGLLRSTRSVTVVAMLALLGTVVWVNVVPSFSLAQLGVISAFAVGAAAYSVRDRIVLDWRIAMISIVAAALSSPTPVRAAVWTLALAYLAFYVAYAVKPVLTWLTARGDASYGIYIYAFPIQQTIVWAWDGTPGPWTVVAIATPIVWILGHVSWRLIEKPALRHKPHPSRRIRT